MHGLTLIINSHIQVTYHHNKSKAVHRKTFFSEIDNKGEASVSLTNYCTVFKTAIRIEGRGYNGRSARELRDRRRGMVIGVPIYADDEKYHVRKEMH